MKKAIFCVVIVLVGIMTATACKKVPDPVDSGIDPFKRWDESSTIATPDDEKLNNDESPEPQIVEDPLAVLLVTEEFAKEKGLLCLYRDEKLYSLGPKYITSDGKYVLPTGFDDGKEHILNADLPEITIQEGDQIRDYGDKYLNVYKSTFLGYTICMFDHGDYGTFVMDDEIDPSSNGKPKVMSIQSRGIDITQFEIKDSSGNTMLNTRHLDRGCEYKITWYSGIDYNELSMIAEWKYYSIEETPSYNLEGALTQHGYALIDIRDLPSGTYHINGRDTLQNLSGEAAFPITIP